MTADKPNGHDNDGNPIQYSVSNRADTPRIYYAIWEDYSIDDEEEVDESGFCSGAISTEGGGNLHWETNQFQVVHKDDYDALAARVKELEAERDEREKDCHAVHAQDNRKIEALEKQVQQAFERGRNVGIEERDALQKENAELKEQLDLVKRCPGCDELELENAEFLQWCERFVWSIQENPLTRYELGHILAEFDAFKKERGL